MLFCLFCIACRGSKQRLLLKPKISIARLEVWITLIHTFPFENQLPYLVLNQEL